MNTGNKRNKVFISHSFGDAGYAKAMVELLEDIGLGGEEIICSSVDAYKIPLRKNIYDYLAEQFQNCNLHVLFLLSRNYYASAASLNEMGAAWVLKHKCDAVLLPGMQFEDLTGCIDKNQISMKLDSDEEELKHRLNEFQKDITEEFSKPSINMSKWERNRGEFLDKVRALMADAGDVADKGSGELLSMEAAVLLAYASEDRGAIYVMRDSEGVHIQAGIWDFAGKKAMDRTIAQWEEAIEELLRFNMIKRTGKRDQIYVLTHCGYEMAEVVKKKLDFKDTEFPDVYLSKSVAFPCNGIR